MRGITKKEIRTILNCESRATFNRHINRGGLRTKLPSFFYERNTFYGEEIALLERVFNTTLIA